MRRRTRIERRSMVALFAVIVSTQALDVPTQARRPLQQEVAENEVALRDVLPQADSFRFLDAPPRHFRGYTHSTGEDATLVGFAFFTIDLVGGVLGYKGRINMLVGMDVAGTLTKVRILSHSEPFGYFSIDPPAFAEQFRGASILDPLEPGEDIDAVSQATITVDAATRAIRLSARLVAREESPDIKVGRSSANWHNLRGVSSPSVIE